MNDDEHSIFRRRDLERCIGTDDEIRWARLRDQRMLLRNIGNQARHAPGAHPATRIAAHAARVAAWLLEPVTIGDQIETRWLAIASIAFGITIGATLVVAAIIIGAHLT